MRAGEGAWETIPCYIAWIHTRIKVDGTIIPCATCDLSMGNLQTHSFDEIWNGSVYRDFRRKTLSTEGLKRMGAYCDCGFCCHYEKNLSVHRIFKWFSPLNSVRKRVITGIGLSLLLSGGLLWRGYFMQTKAMS
ncbi:SPASM domain-containing protein [candidate division CSSED10-310 bacterium]|uniref:SPASM domain-containing protein n=1 Tax=candidate division CSSED10-310 bacterium TaxID=2855610 RepID=A0ABV6Z6V3_UNCC1